jgi:FkbM family methyltransferase
VTIPRLRRAFRVLSVRAVRLLLVGLLRPAAALGSSMQQHAARRARRLPAGIWRDDSTVTVRRGRCRYRLDIRDNVQRAFYFTGWYERRYVTALVSALRKDDVFVDVGAHVGIHTLAVAVRLSELEGGCVLAFEPASDTCLALQNNVCMNKLNSYVQVVPLALGAQAEKLALRNDPLRFDAADAAVRSFYGPGTDGEEVSVVKFDDWADQSGIERIDIVKIDVEGAELAVLRGMQKSIARFHPRLIGVEIRDYLLQQANFSEQELRMWLETAGYRQMETGDLEGNYLFARDGDPSN